MRSLSGLSQSSLIAVRSLRRTPFFASAVVVILALGISANLTIFRVLDRLLLSPPEQIRTPNEVKRLYVLGRSPFTGEVEHSAALTYRDYRALVGMGGFDQLAGYSNRSLTLFADGAGETVSVEMATASYFDLLGVRPSAGRFYGSDEDVIGAPSVGAVLAWSFWQKRFSGDRDVLGRELSIGQAHYTVIGIAPRGFTGVGIAPIDVWLPLHPALAAEQGGTAWMDAPSWYVMASVARVAGPQVVAEQKATAVIRQVRADARRSDPEARVVLASLIAARGPNASRESRVARMLGVLAGLVLLITCANVGNLYLARVLGRRRELAVQAALGVTRWRLFAQLISEALVIALLAGTIAWWLGTEAAGVLFRVLLPDAAVPTSDGLRFLLVTGGLALVTALLTGFLPALRATRVDVMEALRRGTATRRMMLLRRGLLTVQAALSVVLLVGAGLFIRSLHRAESVDFGLDTSTVTVNVELPGGTVFGEEMSSAVLRLLPRVRESGLVESAAATSLAPFLGWWGLSVSSPEGASIESGASGPFLYAATGDYFSTIGLPIVRGRALTDADGLPGAAPVAVVNERLAARLWPEREALGRCLLTEVEEPPVCATVVGVARDFLPALSADEAPFVFYVPMWHPAVGAASANTILARVPDHVTLAMIRDFVRAIAPELRLVNVSTLAQRVEPSLRAWQMGAALLSAVGILALVIAAAGLYSMLTFDVLQRRRELGIRAALGASWTQLVRATAQASVMAVGLGVLIGLAASLLGGRAIETMLFRVSASDPTVYAVVCVVLLGVGLVAGVLPARRATRTDPAIPLREE